MNTVFWSQRLSSHCRRSYGCVVSAQLQKDGTHVWPKKSTAVTASNFLLSPHRPPPRHATTRLRIGLLGSPHFFKKLKPKLDAIGGDSKILFIPHHGNPLVRILYNNSLFFRMFLFLRNVRLPYQKLSGSYTSQSLGSAITKQSFDIAFHKLGFIIKKNIISAFPLGIINDHWGPLPEVGAVDD